MKVMNQQLNSGEWHKSLNVQARKLKMNGSGVATSIPTPNWMVTVFYQPAEKTGKPDYYLTSTQQV